ncbi:hypothetical protein A2141_04715 [Candidatus Woesebacteria bacterium RBG_16_40_11]|nr:MAG: hypothetical protein A2141_04715 [Candidatus Woesebacteria bacterium RBG_16_40_11]
MAQDQYDTKTSGTTRIETNQIGNPAKPKIIKKKRGIFRAYQLIWYFNISFSEAAELSDSTVSDYFGFTRYGAF